MPRWHTDNDIFDEARTWKWRAIRASMGSTTGLIVMAFLGRAPKIGPAFQQWCNITRDGIVESQLRQNGVWLNPQKIGKVEDVRDNLRRLADHCKFSDADREAMFEEFRRWIRRDFRASSGEPL